MGYSNKLGRDCRGNFKQHSPQEFKLVGDGSCEASNALAYSDSKGRSHYQGRGEDERGERNGAFDGSSWASRAENYWRIEPDVGRVADGVPNRVDRLRALGNSLVPQIAEMLGRAIVARDSMVKRG
jgi:hypothetical protein